MKREITKTPSLVGLGGATNDLQQHLYDSLPWLEKSYGLASNGYLESDEKLTLTVPEVYKANGRYEAVLPDAKNTSHSFIWADSAEVVEEYYPLDGYRMHCDVSVVFWMDLEKVKKAMAYDLHDRFTDELIQQAIEALAQYGSFRLSRIERDAKKVWQGWTIGRGVLYFGDHKEYAMTQIFKHPESGFRLHGRLYYDKPCAYVAPEPEPTGNNAFTYTFPFNLT